MQYDSFIVMLFNFIIKRLISNIATFSETLIDYSSENWFTVFMILSSIYLFIFNIQGITIKTKNYEN